MKLSRTTKWMIALLTIATIAGVLDAILQAAGLHLSPDYAEVIALVALILLLAVHSKWQLGAIRGIGFFIVAGLLGFIFEVWGLRGGTFFGGHYVYNGSELKLLGVPYFIPIYWAVFIYTAYSISNSYRAWLGRRKPSRSNSRLASIIPIVILDGLLTVAVDLILDPIKVREGAWGWIGHGSYFGIPPGNFVGWFIVTILATGTYRFYEYLNPVPPPRDTPLLLIPVVGYGFLGVGLCISAVIYGMYSIAAIGAGLVVMPTLANIGIYVKQRQPVR